MGDEHSGGDGGERVVPEAGARVEGAALQHIDRRDDGMTAAVGFGDFIAEHGDDVQFGSIWVGAFSPDGELAWSSPIPLDEALESAEPTGVALAADGSVVVSIVDYADFPESANRVMKFGADGVLRWDTVLDARPFDVVSLADGGAVAVGYALVDEGNAIAAWSVRLSPDGEIERTRSWSNPEGRNSSFASVAVASTGLVLAGTWGLGPLTADSEGWVVFSDLSLEAAAEIRLPHSGGTDVVLDGVAAGEHAVVAVFDANGQHVSEVSPDGVVSDASVPDGLAFLGFAGPGAYLATDACEDCDARLYGVEGSAVVWDAEFEGCTPRAADGVTVSAVAASLSCGSGRPDSELWILRPE